MANPRFPLKGSFKGDNSRNNNNKGNHKNNFNTNSCHHSVTMLFHAIFYISIL